MGRVGQLRTSRTRQRFKLGRYIAPAVSGYRAMRTRFRGNGGSGGSSRKYPAALTAHHDRGTIYRYKRMPYRRKRQWKNFTRKVQHVLQKTTGSKFTVITRKGNATSPAGAQGYFNIHTVMGLNGSASTSESCRDVSHLFDLAVQAGIINQKNAGKIVVTGFMAETQIHNIGSEDVWLDCYYWRCKKPVPKSTATDGFGVLWAESMTDMLGIFPPGGSKPNPNSYGVTPFQGGNQMAKSIRIWKKTRQLIAPGNTIQLETRSGKNYVRSWAFDEEYAMDRCTEGILFLWYGVPTAANDVSTATSLQFSTNVNYTWHVIMEAQQFSGTFVS